MTLAWADTPHRHRHRFEAWEDGPRFVKFATDPVAAEELRREAEVLRLLRRHCPSPLAMRRGSLTGTMTSTH